MLSEENAEKLEQALTAFGFGGVGLTAQDFLQPGIVVQLGYLPNRIDLLTGISGVEFAQAWGQRVSATYDGVLMHFVDKATLQANKAATGRAKDVADLDALP